MHHEFYTQTARRLFSSYRARRVVELSSPESSSCPFPVVKWHSIVLLWCAEHKRSHGGNRVDSWWKQWRTLWARSHQQSWRPRKPRWATRTECGDRVDLDELASRDVELEKNWLGTIKLLASFWSSNATCQWSSPCRGSWSSMSCLESLQWPNGIFWMRPHCCSSLRAMFRRHDPWDHQRRSLFKVNKEDNINDQHGVKRKTEKKIKTQRSTYWCQWFWWLVSCQYYGCWIELVPWHRTNPSSRMDWRFTGRKKERDRTTWEIEQMIPFEEKKSINQSLTTRETRKNFAIGSVKIYAPHGASTCIHFNRRVKRGAWLGKASWRVRLAWSVEKLIKQVIDNCRLRFLFATFFGGLESTILTDDHFSFKYTMSMYVMVCVQKLIYISSWNCMY